MFFNVGSPLRGKVDNSRLSLLLTKAETIKMFGKKGVLSGKERVTVKRAGDGRYEVHPIAQGQSKVMHYNTHRGTTPDEFGDEDRYAVIALTARYYGVRSEKVPVTPVSDLTWKGQTACFALPASIMVDWKSPLVPAQGQLDPMTRAKDAVRAVLVRANELRAEAADQGWDLTWRIGAEGILSATLRLEIAGARATAPDPGD